jgi:hypothetical protein
LETVREERLQTLTLSRLSRLKEVRDGEAKLTAPDPLLSAVPPDRTEIDKVRRAYQEKFIKMLP